MTRRLGLVMLITDLGLLGYWVVTGLAAAGLIEVPMEWLYPNYHSDLLIAWNWSFFPLDLALSMLGLTAVRLAAQNDRRREVYCLASLSLTFCAGLMALSFWAIRGEFLLTWWGINLYLLTWPLVLVRDAIAAPPVTEAEAVVRLDPARPGLFAEAPKLSLKR